jgi:hypothetical protein
MPGASDCNADGILQLHREPNLQSRLSMMAPTQGSGFATAAPLFFRFFLWEFSINERPARFRVHGPAVANRASGGYYPSYREAR